MSLRIAMILMALTVVGVSFVGCTNKSSEGDLYKVVAAQQAEKVIEKAPLSWEKSAVGKEWTKIIYTSIDENFLALDIASDLPEICMNYRNLPGENRKNILAELFSAMALKESSWTTTSKYTECGKKPGTYRNERYVEGLGYCMKGGHKLDGGLVISRGPLQLSLESSQGYGCSWIKTPQDLHDAQKNLSCGVQIMKKQIARTGMITTSSNYWSVLKPTSKRNPEIKAMVRKVPGCS